MSQPALGILTLYANRQKQLGERLVYQKMITAGKKLGLKVFVFTPQDVDERRHRVYALHYHPRTKLWNYKWTPFPDMILDRCRRQNRTYCFEKMSQFRHKYSDVLFLNSPLVGNKWTIYQLLSTIPTFKKHLPSTRLYQSIRDIQEMIHLHPLIYLKPIDGSGGRGVLRIQRAGSYSSRVYVQGKDPAWQIIQPHKFKIRELAIKLDRRGARNRYLVQQGISLKLPNNRVHDYRMLVQKDGSGNWEVTGCVGRVGASKSVTSNLHGGGEAVCMDELLPKWIGDKSRVIEVKDDVRRISLEITQFLEQQYGTLCELALDLAIDRTGHIWLLEVNPKPAREVFNRVGDRETYQRAITRPLEYAAWAYQQRESY